MPGGNSELSSPLQIWKYIINLYILIIFGTAQRLNAFLWIGLGLKINLDPQDVFFPLNSISAIIKTLFT